MVIDSHTHIYPDKIAQKASQSIGGFYNIEMTNASGSVSNLLKCGEDAGIDKFLIHSVATNPQQVESIDNFIIRSVDEHPNKFIGFATGHPDLPNPERELERAMSAGLRGVKLHPDFQLFAITDKRMWPLYKFCEKYGIPILFHTGDYRYKFSNPSLVPALLNSFPELKLICAHFGGWSEWDEALKYLPQTNVMVDCSSSFFALSDERIMEMIDAYGADRVFFGSDFPMWNPKSELQRLRSLPLDNEALEKIEGKNLKDFLGL